MAARTNASAASPPSSCPKARAHARSGATAADVTLREPRRKTVEGGGRSAVAAVAAGRRGAAHLAHDPPIETRPAKIDGSERFQVRLARKIRHRAARDAWLRRGAVGERRCRVEREHDLGAQPVQLRALKLVQRRTLGGRQELLRRLRYAGLVASLALRRAPRAASGRIRGQLGRSLEERGRCGDAPRACRALGRALELLGQVSSGPEAACARCHARRSGSRLGSVASASARCTSRRSGRDAAR